MPPCHVRAGPICQSSQQLNEFIDRDAGLSHPRYAEASSNRCDESVKRFRRDRKPILLESGDVLPDRIAGVLDCFLSGTALANATREAGALGDPLAILSSANDDLTHEPDSRISAKRCQKIYAE